MGADVDLQPTDARVFPSTKVAFVGLLTGMSEHVALEVALSNKALRTTREVAREGSLSCLPNGVPQPAYMDPDVCLEVSGLRKLLRTPLVRTHQLLLPLSRAWTIASVRAFLRLTPLQALLLRVILAIVVHACDLCDYYHASEAH